MSFEGSQIVERINFLFAILRRPAAVLLSLSWRIEQTRSNFCWLAKAVWPNRVALSIESGNFQTILKNSELHFQIIDFIYSEVKFQFVTRMDSFLQFWEYFRISPKLEFCHDQNWYFLTFQHQFYGKSKFQSLSGKHIG